MFNPSKDNNSKCIQSNSLEKNYLEIIQVLQSKRAPERKITVRN